MINNTYGNANNKPLHLEVLLEGYLSYYRIIVACPPQIFFNADKMNGYYVFTYFCSLQKMISYKWQKVRTEKLKIIIAPL
jgi:hypothetical protein